jgi:teichuronic acid biosynthesis glycosyltransferase TuaG
MDAKISIITANFNSHVFIQDTYNSIFRQTISNWEWLVTDDCSCDGSFDMLKMIAASDKRVKLFKNSTNLGAAIARNKSIAQAKGRFIAFIDADDLWAPEKLEKQMAFMLTNNAGISFTTYKIISEYGDDQHKEVDLNAPSIIDYHGLLSKRATFGCSTVMIDKNIVGSINMPNMRTGQDYATWLSILKIGFVAHLLREPLSSYRIVSGSISRNKFKKALRQWTIYRSHEKLSLFLSTYYFLWYAFRAVFRY